mmetsp:Transcript_11451/g.28200  ORF Transcript_11451/g.28200 Transcript_11451/m.28200 type:complete len:930 (+) Transcript_11451:146-2935(+)
MTSLSGAIRSLFELANARSQESNQSNVEQAQKLRDATAAKQQTYSIKLNVLTDIIDAVNREASGNKPETDLSMDLFRTVTLATLAIHPHMHAKKSSTPGLNADKCRRVLVRAYEHLRKRFDDEKKAGLNMDTQERSYLPKIKPNGVRTVNLKRASTEEAKLKDYATELKDRTRESDNGTGTSGQLNEEELKNLEPADPPTKNGFKKPHGALRQNSLFSVKSFEEIYVEPEKMRVVFDPSKPLGMVFADTIVKKVRAGGQADLYGVQVGWRIVEVCGKPVIRGFKGSDRSIFYNITKDKSIPIGVVFECRDENPHKRAPVTAQEMAKASAGAGEVTLVFEANDIGLSIITSAGVVDKVAKNSEAESLGVSPGWVVKSIDGMLLPAAIKGISIDDYIQQTLVKIVSSEEPVKVTFLLPHRIRPDILSEILTSPRKKGPSPPPYPPPTRQANSDSNASNTAADSADLTSLPPTSPPVTNKGASETSSFTALFSSRPRVNTDITGTPRSDAVELASPRDFVSRARQAFAGLRRRRRSSLSELDIKRMHEQVKEQWTNLLDEWHKSPKDIVQRARRLARREGVPPAMRAKVWAQLLGNPAHVTPKLYDNLLGLFRFEASMLNLGSSKVVQSGDSKRSTIDDSQVGISKQDQSVECDLKRSGEDGQNSLVSQHKLLVSQATSFGAYGKLSGTYNALTNNEKETNLFEQIRTDISRTFAHLSFFQDGCLLHDQLHELLCVYAKYRPDVGYVQGMSFLAGHLLLYIEDVYMAFVVLANLLNTPLFSPLFRPKGWRHAYTEHYNIHRALLSQHVPQVHQHFENEGVEPDMYMLEWLITLFSRRLRLDTSGRVWDMYLTHGVSYVHKAAIGIVKLLQKQLLAAPFAKCLKILKEETANIEPEELIVASDAVRLKNTELIIMRKKEMNEGSRGYFVGEYQ